MGEGRAGRAPWCLIYIHTECRGHIHCPDSEEMCVLDVYNMYVLHRESGYIPGPVRCEAKHVGGCSGSLCVECPTGTMDQEESRLLC